MSHAIMIEKNKLENYGLKADKKYKRVWIAKTIFIWTYKNENIIKINYANGLNIILNITDYNKFYKILEKINVTIYVYHPKSDYGSFKYVMNNGILSIGQTYTGVNKIKALELLFKISTGAECELDSK